MSYFSRILLLPVGSYEYHGTELPADTDTIIATRVCEGLLQGLRAAFKGDVTLLPSLAYGLSPEHHGQPTTASVRHNTYYNFMIQLLSSVSTGRDLCVVINGHGGNNHALGAVESDFNYRYQDRKLFVPHLYPNSVKDLSTELVGEFDAHAGSVEASLIAHYCGWPSREYEVPLPKRIRGALRFFKSIEVTSHGVIKRYPNVIADPVRGEKLHQAMVSSIAESIIQLANELSDVLTQ